MSVKNYDSGVAKFKVTAEFCFHSDIFPFLVD